VIHLNVHHSLYFQNINLFLHSLTSLYKTTILKIVFYRYHFFFFLNDNVRCVFNNPNPNIFCSISILHIMQ